MHPQLATVIRELESAEARLSAEAFSARFSGLAAVAHNGTAKLRYNLYSCLTILPPHQHRHLWQAERVLEQLQSER